MVLIITINWNLS